MFNSCTYPFKTPQIIEIKRYIKGYTNYSYILLYIHAQLPPCLLNWRIIPIINNNN